MRLCFSVYGDSGNATVVRRCCLGRSASTGRCRGTTSHGMGIVTWAGGEEGGCLLLRQARVELVPGQVVGLENMFHRGLSQLGPPSEPLHPRLQSPTPCLARAFHLPHRKLVAISSIRDPCCLAGWCECCTAGPFCGIPSEAPSKKYSVGGIELSAAAATSSTSRKGCSLCNGAYSAGPRLHALLIHCSGTPHPLRIEAAAQCVRLKNDASPPRSASRLGTLAAALMHAPPLDPCGRSMHASGCMPVPSVCTFVKSSRITRPCIGTRGGNAPGWAAAKQVHPSMQKPRGPYCTARRSAS